MLKTVTIDALSRALIGSIYTETKETKIIHALLFLLGVHESVISRRAF